MHHSARREELRVDLGTGQCSMDSIVAHYPRTTNSDLRLRRTIMITARTVSATRRWFRTDCKLHTLLSATHELSPPQIALTRMWLSMTFVAMQAGWCPSPAHIMSIAGTGRHIRPRRPGCREQPGIEYQEALPKPSLPEIPAGSQSKGMPVTN
jgi:hypothetical protein